jgi:hypothetical protein
MSSPDREAGRPPGPGAGEDDVRCASCREPRPRDELDERLWCPGCRDALDRKLRLWTHGTALAVTVPFGVWVYTVRTSEVISPVAWLLPLGAAYYLGWRIGKELVKGWVRLTRRQE